MLYEKPIFFEKNRVFRVYTGGALLGRFVDDGSTDGFFPEEWIASAVEANNHRGVENEGISVVRGTNTLLTDLIAAYPREMLGDRKELGVLVKFLDSAIRLPVQAHPDKPFSRQYFHADHGKEESWIVLAKRPGGCIYYGFQPGVTREMFEKAIDDSLTDKDAMEKLLVRHEVNPGDVVFVPARTVHAIGAGCLILEIQEPTDFTIQPEHFCGDYQLNDTEMYLGLTREQAVSVFDYEPVSKVFLTPATLREGDGFKVEELIGEKQSDNFGVNRITLTGGRYTPDKSAAIYVVTDGEGAVEGDGYQAPLTPGEYFLLPHAAVGHFTITGNVTVAECFGK